MRIKIKFTENKTPVPMRNQSDINYYVHKCLGEGNKYHDSKNDYSISNLQGGRESETKTFQIRNGKKIEAKNLEFKNGGYIIVTSLNSEFLNDLIKGIVNNPEFKWGMEYKNIEPIEENFFNGLNHFATLTPFIVKKYTDKKTYTFATINDDDFEEVVKSHLINKLTATNPDLNLDNFNVIIKKHPSHTVKPFYIKNVRNQANNCHVSIFCSKEVASKIYNFGLGQSTGSGFGTIYKTENHSKYRN